MTARMLPESARGVATRVVRLLVGGDYQGIVRLTRGRRLSAEDIDAAIKEYGRHLREPPEEMLRKMDAVLVTGSSPPTWDVRVDLWTVEEGRSDLSALMWIRESAGDPDIELLDLHVL